MITKKTIMEAWTFLREKNCSIPNETLDFMRDISLNKLKEIESAMCEADSNAVLGEVLKIIDELYVNVPDSQYVCTETNKERAMAHNNLIDLIKNRILSIST